VTYPYDVTGCSGSTSTTSRAARSYSYDAPYHSGSSTMPGTASYSPTQPLIEPGLENREYEYLPFGSPYSPTTTVSLPQRYTYTGREKNPASALMYYRYRSYDPRVGRFGARDRLGYFESILLYRYAGNRPSRWRDPRGLWSVDADEPCEPALIFGMTGVMAHPNSPDSLPMEIANMLASDWQLGPVSQESMPISRLTAGFVWQGTQNDLDFHFFGMSYQDDVPEREYGRRIVDYWLDRWEDECCYPVILIFGHSWGGSAAVSLADYVLNDCGAPVDYLGLVDPVVGNPFGIAATVGFSEDLSGLTMLDVWHAVGGYPQADVGHPPPGSDGPVVTDAYGHSAIDNSPEVVGGITGAIEGMLSHW